MPGDIGIRRSVIVLVGVLAVAVGGVGFASATHSSKQTLRVREAVTSSALVDVGTSGLSAGDEVIYHLRIRTLAGKPFGVNDAVCTVLTPVSAGVAHCVGTARLPRGSLEWAGVLPLRAVRSQFAVSGGTGIYRSAAGQVFARWTNPPTNTRALVTVQLVS